MAENQLKALRYFVLQFGGPAKLPSFWRGGNMELYGILVSQPTRCAAWLCMINDLPFELKRRDPLSGETKSKEFLAMNPTGLIPTLRDGDFVLFECNAIMIYLCEKYNWTQWYPTDLITRSKVCCIF